MGRRLAAALVTAAAALCAAASPVAADQRLLTIDTPSEHVDEASAIFNGERPKVLQANVLLPGGYDADAERRWPVLFLLHGAGDSHETWAKPGNGDILRTAKGFPGIIVMPEGGKGFYTNWFNGGKRADPGWERFYLEELIPQIERDFRIAPGRGNHAIAGLSMGGFGAAYLGGQRPEYFGTVSTFSGFVQPQRQTVKAAFSTVAGVEFEQVFGPLDGPYATGHNPTRLAANLRNTPVFAATGNGVADPAVHSEPGAVAAGGLVEADIGQQNEEFAAALRAAGVELDYRPQLGVHDWPYWRAYLRAAIEWGLFRDDAVDDPARWTYTTIATVGRMWGMRYRFGAPPEQPVTFVRDGGVVRAEGRGGVALTDVASGCSIAVSLPFEGPPPSAAVVPWCGRLRVRVAPVGARAGRSAVVRVRVTRAVRGAGELPVPDALVRVGRSTARTDDRGRVALRHRFARYAGSRRVRVAAAGLGSRLVLLRVR